MLPEDHRRPHRHPPRDKEFALHILFVCTGNICRSPVAERLTVAYAEQAEIRGLGASSAGTRAVVAHPIAPEAALILEELGGDASNFAARQLSAAIAASADLVLTMTRAHRDAVLALAPAKLHRTFTLSEAATLASEYHARSVTDLAALRPHVAAREPADVADPIGRSQEFHSAVAAQIAELLVPVLQLCRGE